MFIVRLSCLETFDKQHVAKAGKKKVALEDLVGACQNNTPFTLATTRKCLPALTHISPPEWAVCRMGPVMNYTKAHSLWEIWMVQERRGSKLERQIAFTVS